MSAGLGAFARRVLLLGVICWLASLCFGKHAWPSLQALLWLSLSAFWAEMRSSYLPGFGVINFGEGLYLGASLRYGGPLAGPVAALVGLACDLQRRKDSRVTLFNLGWALSTFSLAGWVGSQFNPEAPLEPINLAWLVAAALAYGACAGGLQAGCQTHMENMSWSETLRHQLRLLKLSVPSAALLALLSQSLLGLAPWAILMVLFPVEMLAAYVRVEQLHQQLLQAQAQIQAQGRQVAMGLMAAGVAHEINNPLAAVSTSAQMLQRLPLPPKAGPCVDLILKAVDRCQSITRRMLTYARTDLEAGGPALLHSTVEDALLFLHERLKKARLLDFNSLNQAPPVALSPGALVQVISNLLSNAADAGAAEIRLEHKLNGNRVELRCIDNGHGIDKSAAERIFDPFFTTKQVGEGTGLGLALCQGLVEKVGGRLQLEKTSPQGSCFLLSLPRQS